jgi:glycosyltransferase EpsE
MTQPLVTVIYPVFNDSPKDINQSLKSIVNQDYKNLEIIVIDDSTDATSIKAIDSFLSDSRLKILRENSKKGLAQALNNGIKIATGKYIARADADDIQYKKRISTQVEYLEKYKDIGILGCNVNYINGEGAFVKQRIFPETSDKIDRYLHLRNPICHSVVMIRKAVLDQIGAYDADFRRAEDYELWFRASKNNIKLYNLQEVLLDYKMANADKRDDLNWKMNLVLKKKYFSASYFLESILGLASVYLYLYTPKSIQNFIYNKLA